MKTTRISQAEMQKRIARFRELKPLPIQNEAIPEKARDVLRAQALVGNRS